MSMNRKAALAAGAGLVAILAACSDSATAPSAVSARPSTPSFAIGDVVGATVTSVPAVGRLTVCKSASSNVAGTFTVAGAPVNGGSGSAFVGDLVVQPGECRIAAFGNSSSGQAFRVTVTETSAGFVPPLIEQGILDENEGAPPAAVIGPEVNATPGTAYDINLIHGYRLTYTNTVVVTSCTYTKGWYRNNGSETVTAVDGLTADQAREIFAATPGKPGNVTFGGDNSLLNLYQQYLAALLNGGASGPASVQAAITAVGNGTDATGLNITTTLTKEQISAYTETLSAFNEGTFAGFPHCD